MLIDVDDIASIDPELADVILENSRRYVQIFSQVVQEMLPELKDKEVKIDFLCREKEILMRKF